MFLRGTQKCMAPARSTHTCFQVTFHGPRLHSALHEGFPVPELICTHTCLHWSQKPKAPAPWSHKQRASAPWSQKPKSLSSMEHEAKTKKPHFHGAKSQRSQFHGAQSLTSLEPKAKSPSSLEAAPAARAPRTPNPPSYLWAAQLSLLDAPLHQAHRRPA